MAVNKKNMQIIYQIYAIGWVIPLLLLFFSLLFHQLFLAKLAGNFLGFFFIWSGYYIGLKQKSFPKYGFDDFSIKGNTAQLLGIFFIVLGVVIVFNMLISF